MKYVAPSVAETAFNCPHCGALARQFWCTVHADDMSPNALPDLIDQASLDAALSKGFENTEARDRFERFAVKILSQEPFFGSPERRADHWVHNMWIARCFNCRKLTIWLWDKLVYPLSGDAPQPADDMPSDVRKDYEEAGVILNASPRGAAALLRLSIQRLCKHLGEDGKNINDDIGALVKKGLDARIQMALDIVRVVGNNAVHPGQIDLQDDRKTAETLFSLVNLITERMVSEPRRLAEMYASLPEGARKAIERRDAAAITDQRTK